MAEILQLDLPPSVALEPEQRARLLAGGRRDLLARIAGSVFVAPALAVFIGWLSGAFVEIPGMFTALCLAMGAVATARWRLHKSGRASAAGWHHRLFVVLTVLAAAGLGTAGASTVMFDGFSSNTYLSLLTVAAFAAIATQTTSLHRRLSAAMLIAVHIPYVLAFFLAGGRDAHLLLGGDVLFAAMVWRMARQSHESYWQTQLVAEKLRAGSLREAKLSRLAGKAEVATNILHDVGNALNSVGTSMDVAHNLAGRFEATSEDLDKLGDLLHDELERPQPFRGRGAALLEFVRELARQNGCAQHEIRAELERAHRHLAHIKAIVTRQQEHARFTARLERIALRVLIESAVDFVADGFKGAGVEIVVIESPDVLVTVERHKALQIIINLLQNALDASRARTGATVEIRGGQAADGGLFISVRDYGTGIAPEDAPRIFEQGFTTKAHGHGFGLHSSLLLARAMGGDLRFYSEGWGKGSTFTLSLLDVGAQRLQAA